MRSDSQKALAIRVLAEAGRPLRVYEIADSVKAMGYVSRGTKRPNQLQQSLNAVLQRNPEFVRVGRGLYTLAQPMR